MRQNHELDHKQRQLLCCYFDGECSWLERIKARRLLKRSPQAIDYLDQLNKVAAVTKECYSLPVPEAVDLSQQVLARIKQEEYAEKFLGQRQIEVENKRYLWLQSFGWGASGAAVAAAIMLVFTGRLGSAPQMMAFEGGVNRPITVQEASTHSTNNNSASNSKIPSVNTVNNQLELDWVRSDGRVSVIPAPSTNNGVIWVKRLRVKKQPTDLLLPPKVDGATQ
jgi:hypothetical protein